MEHHQLAGPYCTLHDRVLASDTSLITTICGAPISVARHGWMRAFLRARPGQDGLAYDSNLLAGRSAAVIAHAKRRRKPGFKQD